MLIKLKALKKLWFRTFKLHSFSTRVAPNQVCWLTVLWKKCYMQCGVWNKMKIWSSHLLDNLSNCLMNLKNSGDSTGFEPMTSATPVQCSNQLSYEVTQWGAGQFVGLMFSRERIIIWKKCYMQCGVWNQMKIWSSHLHRRGHGFESRWVTWIFQVHETIA